MPDIRKNPSRYLGLWFFCALGAGGCVRSEASLSKQEGSDASAYAQHEHHVPPYKPRDLPSALKNLRGRCAEVVKQRSQKASGPFTKEFQETLDIAGWLPEFAADSDLGQAEWDRVNDASKRLVDQLSKLQTTDSVDSTKTAGEQIESALDSAEEVVHRNAELFPARPVSDQHQNDHDASHHSHSSFQFERRDGHVGIAILGRALARHAGLAAGLAVYLDGAPGCRRVPAALQS